MDLFTSKTVINECVTDLFALWENPVNPERLIHEEIVHQFNDYVCGIFENYVRTDPTLQFSGDLLMKIIKTDTNKELFRTYILTKFDKNIDLEVGIENFVKTLQ